MFLELDVHQVAGAMIITAAQAPLMPGVARLLPKARKLRRPSRSKARVFNGFAAQELLIAKKMLGK